MDTNFEYKHHKYKTKYDSTKRNVDVQTGGLIDNLEDASGADALDVLVQLFYVHKIQIKMLHFQSLIFGAHKALDDYEQKFDANFDRFMEVGQGSYGRLQLSSMSLDVSMLTDQTAETQLKVFMDEVMYKYIDRSFSNYDVPGLMAIRDEMIADLQQLIYLLSFRR